MGIQTANLVCFSYVLGWNRQAGLIAIEIRVAGGVTATSAAMAASAAWGRTANRSGVAEPQGAPAAVAHMSRGC
jgi:hypothetical protein